MWAHLWPGRPADEVPICAITNGVHTPSWLSPENLLLFDRYLGPQWHTRPGDAAMPARIEQIPDEELWRAHEISRSRLTRECRDRLARQLRQRHAGKADIEAAKSVLDPDSLTLGFARRFATYKRAGLLLHDLARLEALLGGDTPIQIVFAGKAHPRDNEGKELIRQIVHVSRRASVRRRLIFLEDYDIDLARTLVQGVDVWLNTPRRPLEASGTSGMKAAVNGALNLSVPDGWWDEAYAPERGWSIGHGEEYSDPVYQDAIESQALYTLLENEVVPCFYTRSADHLPSAWIAMMKASMKMAFAGFSSHRMVREYEERCYIPALMRGRALLADDAAEAQALAAQHARLARLWPHLRVGRPAAQADLRRLRVGDAFIVTVTAELGKLRPDDVDVQLYYGPLTASDAVASGQAQPMALVRAGPDGRCEFECRVDCGHTGRFGFTARAVPRGDDWTRHLPGCLTWADEPP